MQLWICLALFSHFLNATTVILDKYLVSSTVLKPVNYVFYTGVFGFIYLLFMPIIPYFSPNLQIASITTIEIVGCLLGGYLIIPALMCFYKATLQGEVSRVTPIVGTTIPLMSGILFWFLFSHQPTSQQIISFVLLIVGGFLFSINIHQKQILYTAGMKFALMAGIIFACSNVLVSLLYTPENFWLMFIIVQLGSFLGAVSLLGITSYRQEIFSTLKPLISNYRNTTSKQNNNNTPWWFVLNKVLAAVATILLHLSFALGNMVIATALQATQYVFILIFTGILAFKNLHWLQEKINRSVLLQKSIAIVLIAFGLFLNI